MYLRLTSTATLLLLLAALISVSEGAGAGEVGIRRWGRQYPAAYMKNYEVLKEILDLVKNIGNKYTTILRNVTYCCSVC